MAERRKTLTLDRIAQYQIKVPGIVDPHHCDWAGGMEIKIEGDETENPITILTGELDQAALHGLLRRIYSQGLPIISVEWIKLEE